MYRRRACRYFTRFHALRHDRIASGQPVFCRRTAIVRCTTKIERSKFSSMIGFLSIFGRIFKSTNISSKCISCAKTAELKNIKYLSKDRFVNDRRTQLVKFWGNFKSKRNLLNAKAAELKKIQIFVFSINREDNSKKEKRSIRERSSRFFTKR